MIATTIPDGTELTTEPARVPTPTIVVGIFAAANAYYRETARKLAFIGVSPEELLEIEAWAKSRCMHRDGRLMRLPERGLSRSLMIDDIEVFEIWPRTSEGY